MWRTAKEEASYKNSFYEAYSLETNHHCSSPRLFWGSGARGASSLWSTASWLIYKWPFISHFEQFGETYSYHVKEVWMLEKGACFLSSPGMPVWCTLEGSGLENQRLQPIPKSSGSQQAFFTHAAQTAQSSYLSVRSQTGFLINNFYLKFQKISHNSISIRLSCHTLQVT